MNCDLIYSPRAFLSTGWRQFDNIGVSISLRILTGILCFVLECFYSSYIDHVPVTREHQVRHHAGGPDRCRKLRPHYYLLLLLVITITWPSQSIEKSIAWITRTIKSVCDNNPYPSFLHRSVPLPHEVRSQFQGRIWSDGRTNTSIS